MARPKGSPNADFAASRKDLIGRLATALLGEAPPTSLRAMASAAEVTVPTLRHYFGDKDAVLAAVFANCHQEARHELQVAATPTGPFDVSVCDLARHVVAGFRYARLDRLNAVGLIEGLAEPAVAFAYLSSVLEPTIAATEARLQAHIDRGDMVANNARHAAITLLSPIILLFLHQRGLNGETTHPADIDGFVAAHVDGFVRGYGK